jgi:hypothetical protein
MLAVYNRKHSLHSIPHAYHARLPRQRARSILLAAIVVVLHAGFTPNASGQVIRERVEIRPRPHAQQASVAASPQAGTLRIRFTADRQILLRMFIDTMCDEKGLYETVYYGTGAVEVTFAHPLGSVSVDAQPRVAELARGQSTVVRLEAFYNDQLIYTQSATFSGGGWDIFGSGFIHSIGTPFASAFTLFRQFGATLNKPPLFQKGEVIVWRSTAMTDGTKSIDHRYGWPQESIEPGLARTSLFGTREVCRSSKKLIFTATELPTS